MQSVRTVVRTLIAVFLATAGPVLAAPAVRAHAQEVQQQSFRTNSAGSGQLTVSVDGVSPSYATPTATITVRGTVTNDTGSPVTGVQVQLLSSSQYFHTRSEMDSYPAGHDALVYLAPEGTAVTLPGTLHSGKTARWSASFTAASVGYPQFGVYPLAAQAEDPGGTPLAIDRTLLPYWPGNGGPEPLNVAWIWPLIDAPQQGICGATLATNSLADSLGAAGRLGTLLDVGQQWAAQADLTWAVDPALLSDVNVMTSKYAVGGGSTCTGRQYEQPSVAAAQWLSLLRSSTTTEPMFFTPYADADVAALTRAGLQQNTRTAFRLGESAAAKILSRAASAPVAWPTDGTANASTLTSLARDGGVSTVVLNSGEMPSIDGQYDNALNATRTADGATMGVLLADSGITSALGSASASSPAGAQFDAAQDFLADTAMILAEGPSLQRSIVIAPPRHWDPSAAEAGALLSMTSSAPWLHKTDLSSLAAAAAHLSTKAKAPTSAPRGALGADYTSQIAAVSASAGLYKDLLYRPAPNVLDTIDAAVTATTSAAWRGAGVTGGWQALINLGDNLRVNEKKVSIITGKKILLAGASGTTPVSVQNLLPVEVQVRVVATPSAGSQLSVSKFADLIRVPAGQTYTARVPLHSSAITTTTMQLQLQTEDGSPLTWTSQSLSVQATRYGRALLVLIAAALGVVVLTAVARWIRRWLNNGRNSAKADGRSGGTG
jgi:Family of unknown function (DUF6049)